MRQVIHIQSSCCHICSHEQLCQVIAEFLHREITLLLGEISMQRFGIITVFNQFIGYLLRLYLRTAENDGEDTGIEIYDTLQCQVFILGIHHVIDMVHILCTLITTTNHNLFVIMQIGLCHTLHLLTHRGREHQGTMFSRQRLEYLIDTVRETHIQHFIGLIQHNITDQIEMHLSTVHQVNQASRSCHDDLHTFLQGTHLRLNGSTTIDGFHMHTIDVFGKIAQIVGNLQT